eukprot:TRINITY_DN395_c0_g1_i2.p1 TRINITY_DN395_c0_g1~~TRINITY_DN395_c0_g1_i2.p1  ORF type:complete len:349 (-),score=60.35 TRINITY_DN395_c0_g1_i2:182-1168(-)
MTGRASSLQELWTKEVGFQFHILKVGSVFKNSSKICFADNEGKVRIWNGTTPETVLETKGSSICALLLADVTNFGSIDLITGDSEGKFVNTSKSVKLRSLLGSITIFSNNEILSKKKFFSQEVSALGLYIDAAENPYIVAGDRGGTICCFQPNENPWKIRLTDEALRVDRGQREGVEVFSIRVLDTLIMNDASGIQSHYLLACDGRFLHLFSGPSRLLSSKTPGKINTLCKGEFTASNSNIFESPYVMERTTSISSSRQNFQIAFGSQDGYIYLLGKDLQFVRFIQVGYPVTKILTLPSLYKDQKTNAIACCGHFNSVKIYQHGKFGE